MHGLHAQAKRQLGRSFLFLFSHIPVPSLRPSIAAVAGLGTRRLPGTVCRRPRRARRRSQNNIFSRDRPKKNLHTGPSSSLPEQQRTTNRPRRQGKTTISVTLYPQSPGCCGRTIYLPVRRVPRQPQVPLDFPASDCYISRSMALFHPRAWELRSSLASPANGIKTEVEATKTSLPKFGSGCIRTCS